MSSKQPSTQVAVVMRKVRITGPMSRWQPWRWELADVVAHEPAFGAEPRLLRKDENGEQWLHPNFTVELFRDDAEGYYLNATTPAPCWFVLWRMDEEATLSDEPIPRPAAVSVSYHDAGRWLDAQETVEQVPAPPDVVAWFKAYADEHVQAHPLGMEVPVWANPENATKSMIVKGIDGRQLLPIIFGLAWWSLPPLGSSRDGSVDRRNHAFS